MVGERLVGRAKLQGELGGVNTSLNKDHNK